MRVVAFYACLTLLSQTMASLPCYLTRATENGDNEHAKDHPLYEILSLVPNDYQTSFEWRESSMAQILLEGEAYARVIQDGAGRVKALDQLASHRTYPFWTGERMAYRHTPESGGTIYYLNSEILRLPNFSTDLKRKALSVVQYHRQTIGRSIASNHYQSRLLKNAAVPKGAIKTPNDLSPEAVQTLRKQWNERHAGPENAGNVAILYGGLEWETIGLNHEDMQYMEMEAMSLNDIARMFHIPPHKIGDLTRSTNNNIEHQAIEFITDTMRPWARRWEERMELSLLSRAERLQGYKITFDLNALLRGDSAARAALYRVLFAIGALAPNDARRLENLPKIQNIWADETYIQTAMAPLSKIMDVLMRKGPSQSAPSEDDKSGAA